MTQAGGPSTAVARAIHELDTPTVHLRAVTRAGEACAEVRDGALLHPGPPIVPGELAGALRTAVVGALLLEGRARSTHEAEAMLRRGDVTLRSAHDVGAVIAAAGVVSASTPVVVVERAGGGTAFSPLSEGAGRVLRFGCWGDDVAASLRFMAGDVVEVLARAVDRCAVELTSVVAASLRRGDDGHARTVAGRDLLLASLAPAVVETAPDGAQAARVLSWAAANRHLFNTFAIATAKALTDGAARVVGSPLVTAIASNGVRLGVRCGGESDAWRTTTAPRVVAGGRGPYPVVGDSFVAEVAGFGCAALRAAPAVCEYLEIDVVSLDRTAERVRAVSAGTSTRFLVPGDRHRGTPIGLDPSRMSSGSTPVVSAAVVSDEPGGGQVGAALVRLPHGPFRAASLAGPEPTRQEHR